VTLESSLPWLSLATAIGAGAANPSTQRRLETGLRVLALGALAAFAYFRWIAPAAIPLALTLAAIGEGLLPETERRWRRPAAVFPIAAWLTLAQLFWNSGDVQLAFVSDAAKAGLLLALVVGMAWGLVRTWRPAPPPRLGLALGAGALGVMCAASLTLDWDLWPALVGAGAILASQALTLALGVEWGQMRARRLKQAIWALEYVGYAGVAYAFLR
jgi:hypothetical protein